MNPLYNTSHTNKHPFARLALLPEAYLNQKLRTIRNADLTSEKIVDTLKHRFSDLLSYQIRLGLGYAFHYYYRAQKTDSNKLSRLIHPEPKNVEAQGRFNDIAEPLLYCSNSYVTSILEQKPEKGDVITVLITELPDYRNTNQCPPLFFLAKEEINERVINSFTRSDQQQVDKKLKIIGNFLAEITTKNVIKREDYRLSIALGRACFESTENSHLGLVFPSLASKKFGLNFAFKPAWSKVVNNPKNSRLMSFQVEIVDKISEFNATAMITKVAHEIDSEGFFKFIDVAHYGEIIQLNKSFYDEHEKLFISQKITLKEGSFFYRRYAPPEYFFNSSI